ncbi:MAG: PHP domain-containing protein [Candidatus Margulisbacteria bacterium]|nr:PHP domain-containing protein [Candidatus Margulisiibacteriota bacterium]
MPADLHIHTNQSDGTFSPEETVKMAAAAGLKTISLTDHDNVDGLEEAQRVAALSGIELIPGIEMTTETAQAEVHILGYYLDHKNPELLEVLTRIQASRVERIYTIVEKLKSLGVEIEATEVFALSGEKSPGRPHVARALIKKGIVLNFREAFKRFLDFRAPAYVPHFKLTPNEAIKLIKGSGGIAVFAHQAISKADDLIPEMINSGLRGIEAYYLGHYADQVDYYVRLGKKNGLLLTGGSDFHGEDSGRESKLGDFSIPDELVDKLRNEHLRGN